MIETTDDTESLVVYNLHPGESYNFTIVAINQIGESHSSSVLSIKTTMEES